MCDEWNNFQGELNNLPAEEQDEIKGHFNGIIEEFDELGDNLFGEVDEFKDYTTEMALENKKSFVNELLRVELFDE